MPQPAIVFIHGRSQEFKDPDELRRKWLAGLNSGLTLAKFPPLPDSNVHLPYFGNQLYDLTKDAIQRRASLRLERIGQQDIGAEPQQLNPEIGGRAGELQRELIAQMAEAFQERAPGSAPQGSRKVKLEGLLEWPPAREMLAWLSRRTRLDQAIISSFLKDVAVYLLFAGDEVMATVKAKIPNDGKVIIISHSLGTIIARELLGSEALAGRTVLWVTAGSPLGLEVVQRNMDPKGSVSPKVGRWVSAYDLDDVVTAGSPLSDSWTGKITEFVVENGSQPHSISRYLGHKQVAATIGEAIKQNS